MKEIISANVGYDGSEKRWKERQQIDDNSLRVYVYKNNKRYTYKGVNLTESGVGITCADDVSASLRCKDVVDLVLVLYGINSANVIGIYFREGYVIHSTKGVIGLIIGARKR